MTFIASRIFLGHGTRLLRRTLVRAMMSIPLVLLCSISAFAQYGGGGGGGMGGGSGTGSSAPSYGNGKAIGIGVGAAAAGAVAIYAVAHRGTSVTGCLQPADDGLRLTDDKTKRTVAVMAGNTNVQAGERVQLKGKMTKSKAGSEIFEAKKLVKNFGACGGPATAQLAAPSL